MDVQYNYRSALASASGTTVDDVDIIAVTEQVSRRNDDASGASVSASWEMLAQAKEGASSSGHPTTNTEWEYGRKAHTIGASQASHRATERQ